MKLLKRLIAGAVLILCASPAFAAVTYTFDSINGPFSIGGYSEMVTGTMNLSGTYVTGGFAITEASFGLNTINFASFQPSDSYGALWDQENEKVLLQDSIGAGQSSNGADVGAWNVKFMVVGQ